MSVPSLTNALFSRQMASNAELNLAKNSLQRIGNLGFSGNHQADNDLHAEMIMGDLQRTIYTTMAEDASNRAKDQAKKGFTLDYCA
ncbi:MAG: hypothetical protein GX568_08915 [Candidatus Gastranaerophilales bacterium]|nr:hypothetical protein [Candidatus Gastranaerophilales bacterium]